ncbi:MAG: hypothetical protein M3Q49_21535 [Actinomycetota bacterium]|nr:hypothetical protein [Actinomycetota bacterium]
MQVYGAARGGAGTVPRGGGRLQALLAVAAILVILAVMALLAQGVPPATRGVGAEGANLKAGGGSAIVHDDAGNMPPGAGSTVVHDDAGNIPAGAGSAIVHDDASTASLVLRYAGEHGRETKHTRRRAQGFVRALA